MKMLFNQPSAYRLEMAAKKTAKAKKSSAANAEVILLFDACILWLAIVTLSPFLTMTFQANDDVQDADIDPDAEGADGAGDDDGAGMAEDDERDDDEDEDNVAMEE